MKRQKSQALLSSCLVEDTRLCQWRPKWEEAKAQKVLARVGKRGRGLGLQTELSLLGAAVIRQDQFLPACFTHATWHLTMTTESAHCLLKNRHYNLLLELNAGWHQVREIFCKDPTLMMQNVTDLLFEKKSWNRRLAKLVNSLLGIPASYFGVSGSCYSASKPTSC